MAKAEAKLQDSAFKRVVEMLPAETAAIDETQFAHELKSLATEAQELRKEQDDVRVSLVELSQDRQQKTTELNLALASERVRGLPDGAPWSTGRR